jgi:hypothetical protein
MSYNVLFARWARTYAEATAEYFRLNNDPVRLARQIADTQYRSGQRLSAHIYQLSLLIEGLTALDKLLNGNSGLRELRSQLLTVVTDTFNKSGFHYFDQCYLPEDLDTTATVTRVTGTCFPEVVQAYDSILNRNQMGDGKYPTWLDAPNWTSLCCGSRPWHADVMMNLLTTQCLLGRSISSEVITSIATESELRNYWYIQRLYTPYFYCRLAKLAGLERTKHVVKPLLDVLRRQDMNTLGTDPRMLDLVRTSQHRPLDTLLTHLLESYSNPEAVDRGIPAFNPEEFDNIALYWSFGYTPYDSTPVSRSFVATVLDTFSSDIVTETPLCQRASRVG